MTPFFQSRYLQPVLLLRILYSILIHFQFYFIFIFFLLFFIWYPMTLDPIGAIATLKWIWHRDVFFDNRIESAVSETAGVKFFCGTRLWSEFYSLYWYQANCARICRCVCVCVYFTVTSTDECVHNVSVRLNSRLKLWRFPPRNVIIYNCVFRHYYYLCTALLVPLSISYSYAHTHSREIKQHKNNAKRNSRLRAR